MASFTGNSIYDILIGNNTQNARVPNTGASPLDTTHTFTAGGVNLGSVEVLNFYGDQIITSTTNVANTYFPDVIGNQDSIMCIRVFHGNLSITGNIFTPPHRTKGMFVLVKGNLTLGAGGVISMTGKGSTAASQNVFLWGGLSIPDSGYTRGLGGNAVAAASGLASYTGENAAAATGRRTGGGGGGGARKSGSNTNTVVGGDGSAGTSWSGGNGGAGSHVLNANILTASAGHATGTNGGNAVINFASNATAEQFAGGGAGINPGNARRLANGSSGSGTTSTTTPYVGGTGAGGTLMMVVLGNVTSSGTITSNGSSGGEGTQAGGGGSGGGSVNVLIRANTTTDKSAIESSTTCNGGSGGLTPSQPGGNGGNGGTGSKTIETFSDVSVSLPRRTLINASGTYYYRDFNIAVGQTGAWKSAGTTALGTTPFEQYGMFDAEVYALDKSAIVGVPGITDSAVRFEVYQP